MIYLPSNIQTNIPNKNGNVYGPSPFSFYFHDFKLQFPDIKYQNKINTLAHVYNKSLVPPLPVYYFPSNEDIEKSILREIDMDHKIYEHPGLYEFLYYMNCIGNSLQPAPEKKRKLKLKYNKSKENKSEETKKLSWLEQFELDYKQIKEIKFRKIWHKFNDYIIAMELANHFVLQNDLSFITLDSLGSYESIVKMKMRKSKEPYIIHGRSI